MVFDYLIFISMVLSLLKLTQICCSNKFALLFCGIHKFASNSFRIRLDSFQIRFEFASDSFQIRFNICFLSDFFIKNSLQFASETFPHLSIRFRFASEAS